MAEKHPMSEFLRANIGSKLSSDAADELDRLHGIELEAIKQRTTKDGQHIPFGTVNAVVYKPMYHKDEFGLSYCKVYELPISKISDCFAVRANAMAEVSTAILAAQKGTTP